MPALVPIIVLAVAALGGGAVYVASKRKVTTPDKEPSEMSATELSNLSLLDQLSLQTYDMMFADLEQTRPTNAEYIRRKAATMQAKAEPHNWWDDYTTEEFARLELYEQMAFIEYGKPYSSLPIRTQAYIRGVLATIKTKAEESMLQSKLGASFNNVKPTVAEQVEKEERFATVTTTGATRTVNEAGELVASLSGDFLDGNISGGFSI